MTVHVFVFLLVSFLLFCLARFGRLDWFRLRPSFSPGGVKRTRRHRLLKPRCPDDCPVCRLASTPSLGGGPAFALVRHGIAALARRTWATAQQSPQLLAHLEWWRGYYHFVRPHEALRVKLA